jgi:hypothetical protein
MGFDVIKYLRGRGEDQKTAEIVDVLLQLENASAGADIEPADVNDRLFGVCSDIADAFVDRGTPFGDGEKLQDVLQTRWLMRQWEKKRDAEDAPKNATVAQVFRTMSQTDMDVFTAATLLQELHGNSAEAGHEVVRQRCVLGDFAAVASATEQISEAAAAKYRGDGDELSTVFRLLPVFKSFRQTGMRAPNRMVCASQNRASTNSFALRHHVVREIKRKQRRSSSAILDLAGFFGGLGYAVAQEDLNPAVLADVVEVFPEKLEETCELPSTAILYQHWSTNLAHASTIQWSPPEQEFVGKNFAYKLLHFFRMPVDKQALVKVKPGRNAHIASAVILCNMGVNHDEHVNKRKPKALVGNAKVLAAEKELVSKQTWLK